MYKLPIVFESKKNKINKNLQEIFSRLRLSDGSGCTCSRELFFPPAVRVQGVGTCV